MFWGLGGGVEGAYGPGFGVTVGGVRPSGKGRGGGEDCPRKGRPGGALRNIRVYSAGRIEVEISG